MNLKTWQNICGIVFPLAFLSIAAGFVMPDAHAARLASTIGGGILLVLGIAGALLGVMFVAGRLRLNCPLCDSVGPVVGGTGKEIYLDCPSCGRVCGTMRMFRTATSEIVDVQEDEKE